MSEAESPDRDPTAFRRELIERARQMIAKIDPHREWSTAELIADEFLKADKLLRDWAAFAKAMSLHKINGELSDYDSELAGIVRETAHATLEWRDGRGSWPRP